MPLYTPYGQIPASLRTPQSDIFDPTSYYGENIDAARSIEGAGDPGPAIGGRLFSGAGTQAEMEGNIRAQRLQNILEHERALGRSIAASQEPDPLEEQIAGRAKALAYERLRPAGEPPPHIAAQEPGTIGSGSVFDENDPFSDVLAGASSTAPGARSRTTAPWHSHYDETAGLPTIGEVVQQDIGMKGGGMPGDIQGYIAAFRKDLASKGYSSDQIDKFVDKWVREQAMIGAGKKGDYSTMGRLADPRSYMTGYFPESPANPPRRPGD